MSQVTLSEVRKSFGDVDVINGVDLTVDEGEFVVFVGPSGSGKSTLLRIIAGLEDVTSGGVVIGDRDVTYASPAERGIAMVFQSYALYPHMSVFENIAFNLRLSRRPKQDIERLVRKSAEILRLTEYLRRKPSQLSGGQRQRVAIGRAIVRDPKVFLFDEPLSNLDAALRVEMRLEIEKLHRSLGATMVYVTHDQVEAMTLADRIVALDGGEVQQVGTPLELYRNPANLFVAGFIGSPKMNLLPAQAVSDRRVRLGIDGANDVPAGRANLSSGGTYTLGARPEAVRLAGDTGSAEGLGLTGRAAVVENLGNIAFVHFDIGANDLLIAQVPPDAPIGIDQEIQLFIPADDLHLFDESQAV